MKLSGIRFENFACFEECYVPLDEGIQMLVGKNNAGKTAILRGLTALRGLPVGTSDALQVHLGGYARGSTIPGNFDFHVECSFDSGDFGLLGGSLEQWPKARQAKSRSVDFHFRLLGAGNIVGLERADLRLDDHELPLIVKHSDEVMLQCQYNQIGIQAGSMQLNEALDRAIGDGHWPILEANGLLSALLPLKKVRMIEAHRVPRADLNMQAAEDLTPNADNLAQFVDTQSGNNRRKFQELEALIIRVFPEFELVNAAKRQSAVFLTLTKREHDYGIPLTHCGTGVEQLLTLGAFVLNAPDGSTLLIDEPHSYLHPSAERELMTFLQRHPEHRYVISTHSAILINAVPPDRVLPVTSPKMPRPSRQDPPETAALLHSLGYRNSDFLFSDRLIFVEGESDQEILPILLGRNKEFVKSDIAKTGFPKMNGEGKLRGSAKQTPLLYFEKFLKELGKSLLPRIYLFDGDCDDDEQHTLQGTPMLAGNDSVAVRFLPRLEIENYLLVPGAIVKAIQHLANLEARDVSRLNEDAVSKGIQDLLANDDKKRFPDGMGGDPLRTAKGSVVLAEVFDFYGFRYRKRNEGRLLAEHVTAENQTALNEIWDCVRSIFP